MNTRVHTAFFPDLKIEFNVISPPYNYYRHIGLLLFELYKFIVPPFAVRLWTDLHLRGEFHARTAPRILQSADLKV